MLTQRPSTTGFLHNDGECAKLIATRDWSDTLGPPADWASSLKTATGLIIHSPVAMVLLWGEDGVMIYNDAYARFAGGRHPKILGAKVREAWPEAAEFNDNVMKVGLSGETLSYKDQKLTLHRRGSPEQVWMNLDYSPVLNEEGTAAGVLAVLVETTDQVMASRRADAERERLERMFEQAPGIMALYQGPEHVFVLANPAYYQLVGKRDLIGRTVRDALPELGEQGIHAMLDEVYRSGQAFVASETELFFQREPDRPPEARFVDFVCQPITGPDGKVEGIFAQASDVTERKRAEDELREKEERLRVVIDGAKDHAIFTIDPERRITGWSQGAAEIFGMTSEQAIGSCADDLWTPEDRGACQPEEEVATARREGFAEDKRWHQREDGSRVFLNGSVHPLPLDEKGNERGFIKVARDETDRRRTEIALQETEERYRLAARATNDAIWDWDLATGQVVWNEAVRTLFGHADAVAGSTGEWWIGHIHPDDRERVDRDIHAVIDGDGESWHNEYRFLRADGSIANVFDRGTVIRDQNGQAVRMIGAMLDLSERHRAEAALAESEAALRSVLEQMPVGVILANVPGGEVIFLNQAAERILGDRILPQSAGDYTVYGGLHEDGSALAAEEYPLARTVSTGEAQVDFPMRYRRPDGEIVYLEISSSLLQRSGAEPRLAICIFTDVTARIRADRHQRLLIDELSHRAKNLLAIIQSVAQQSFKGDRSRAEMVAAFEGRLGALAAAHGILTRQKWESAPLRQIVSDTITAVKADDDRLRLNGPDMMVSPKTGVSLAMAVHELTTNALKYGSLSNDSGTVDVAWSAENGRLHLRWAERGGPPVSAPTRRGFGSRMIERGLAAELGGTVRIDFQPEGIVCTVDAPLPELA